MADQLVVSVGILLVFLGLLAAFLALVLPAVRSGKLRGKGGAVVVIGPFPIVLGSDKRTTNLLLVLAIAMFTILLALFLVQALW